ncbi:hypothetical protein EMPG_16304 [Blastomyces silverae]|uniref:Uncharacterized protein n=1 Tax=Blastomyces silverae TaxID=2060906 RepID=A0A0H1BGB7_9EURO|nr:hypothetical protein EMPG_16304 [Blastomyces silverae]
MGFNMPGFWDVSLAYPARTESRYCQRVLPGSSRILGSYLALGRRNSILLSSKKISASSEFAGPVIDIMTVHLYLAIRGMDFEE